MALLPLGHLSSSSNARSVDSRAILKKVLWNISKVILKCREPSNKDKKTPEACAEVMRTDFDKFLWCYDL
ncbi:hypothetical protein BSL78_05750 [Apostichopus japonicus]|uniref:Uncharacterized protein n=1 Tax=Stichopus japonicus TaxID=307972 RepID=A0A2G8LAV0_STIJA|nr:hypothetical protein BSL78_05750 [Apostichopus japonicus]